jgi:hypothetical protein
MGFFETNPLALIVVIIVTVEGWSIVKNAIRSLVAWRSERARTSEPH